MVEPGTRLRTEDLRAPATMRPGEGKSRLSLILRTHSNIGSCSRAETVTKSSLHDAGDAPDLPNNGNGMPDCGLAACASVTAVFVSELARARVAYRVAARRGEISVCSPCPKSVAAFVATVAGLGAITPQLFVQPLA